MRPGDLVRGASRLGENVVYSGPSQLLQLPRERMLWSSDVCVVLAVKPVSEYDKDVGYITRRYCMLYVPRENKIVWTTDWHLVKL